MTLQTVGVQACLFYTQRARVSDFESTLNEGAKQPMSGAVQRKKPESSNMELRSTSYAEFGTYCHIGGCQNHGPLLGPLNTRCRITLGTQKETIILTATHIVLRSAGWLGAHFLTSAASLARNSGLLLRSLIQIGNPRFPLKGSSNWVGFEDSIEINFYGLYKDYIGFLCRKN